MKQLANSILELLVDNLKRLNETEESDRQGVFHILGTYPHPPPVYVLLTAGYHRHLRESNWLQRRPLRPTRLKNHHPRMASDTHSV